MRRTSVNWLHRLSEGQPKTRFALEVFTTVWNFGESARNHQQRDGVLPWLKQESKQ
jgi:hypothetical protein